MNEDKKTKYQQIKDHLKQIFKSKKLKIGEKIQSENELSEMKLDGTKSLGNLSN